MTPDARVLRFPSATGGTGAREYGRFTRELSPDELAGCFFFSDDDRGRIATRRGDASRLGFAVQLGTVRYLGRFLENPADVPRSVLGWTIREIGVPAGTTLAGYGDGEARWEHQAEIRRAYGYRPFGDEGVEDELALWLRARAWISAESHRVLFMRAAEHLTARRILLPGYSTLWRLVASACEHTDARGFAMLADTPTGEQRDRLAALLQTPAGRRLSVLERLRRPEVEPTIGGLVNGLARVQELRELADGLGGLDALPVAAAGADGRRRALPSGGHRQDERRAADSDADGVRDHRDRTRPGRRAGALRSPALASCCCASARKANASASPKAKRSTPRAARSWMPAASSSTTRSANRSAMPCSRLWRATSSSTPSAQWDASPSRLTTARASWCCRAIAACVATWPALLDTITFLANDAGEPILAALDGLRQAAGQRTLTPAWLPTGFVSRPWRTLVEPRPGEIDRGAYTMCALEGLRDALRRRDVYVAPSERYADARASLLGDAAWDASREDTQRSLSLPARPGPFLEQLGGELDDAYQRTRDGLMPEHPIHELAAGGLRIEQLDALPEPPTLTSLRERVDALLPAADLPDLVLEIAAKTGFIDAFTNDQEPGAKLEGLATSLCAVLVAQACNVGYKPLVDESNPALREARLRYVAQRYLRPETLAAANARIVDVHAKLPLAERWGGGEVASIDGLRFVVPRRTIHAAYNRRYFDRRRGVTLLGTTADHYAGLHTVVITGTQPDAPYMGCR